MASNKITARLPFIVLIVLMLHVDAGAQNSTSSPLSVFGIGEIETRDFGRTGGMGNAGIGIKSHNFLNRRNPAGLSGIDTLTFILDISAAVKLADFRIASQQERTTDFNFKNLSIGFRASKIWTVGVGLSPYSNVGYSVNKNQPTIGSPDQNKSYFSGNGGVNKFYWSNSFEVLRGLSLGVTASYLFGTITHNESIDVMSASNSLFVSQLYCDFGMQYSRRFGSTLLTVGGVYGYEQKINISHSEVVSGNGSDMQTIIRDQVLGSKESYIPESYGFGFSILRDKKDYQWLFAADYQYQNWSVDKSHQGILRYTDSHMYSVGLQLVPNHRRPESYWQAMRFQAGGCYNQSYLAVNGYQLTDYSVSLGVGLPFRRTSFINLAVNLGESATGKRGGITERYALLSVNLSLIELWFSKQKWE